LAKRFTDKDIQYMRQALDLASRGHGQTSPNPMVGAVLVKNGKVVGEGFHRRAGEPHAEILALRRAGKNAKGATLYINLEPCCHYGKTPPCTDALIGAGISRVVAAMKDPNALVGGKGFAHLRRAGVKVKVGLLRKEAERLNETFIHFHRFGRPFVVLKWAMTIDGRTSCSNGESRWISGSESRRYAHKLRSFSDAVLVGIGTVLRDNCQLSARLAGYRGKQPLRIIVDSELKIPLKARCLSNIKKQPTMIATSQNAPIGKIEALRSQGCNVLICRKTKDGISIRDLTGKLAEMSMQSLLVEGGRRISGSFLREGLADKIVAFISPKVLGGKKLTSPIANWEAASLDAVSLRDVTIRELGNDVCIEGYLRDFRKR
jgi:diaminohydroxyphosphoribosylaminopyrimidine deaminase/5-amino-6-(5-phosphoribosylamino)uracil reductase